MLDGSVAPALPVAYRLVPNSSAAPSANATAAGWLRSSRRSVSADSGTADRHTPIAMTASARPTPGERLSPASSAISAAIAPSVETSGATRATCPIRNAL